VPDDAGHGGGRRWLPQRDRELSGAGASLLAVGLVMAVLVVVVTFRLFDGEPRGSTLGATPSAAPSSTLVPPPPDPTTTTLAADGADRTVRFEFEQGPSGWTARGGLVGERHPGFESETALVLRPAPGPPPELGGTPAGARLAQAPAVLPSPRRGARVRVTAWVAAPRSGVRAILRLEEIIGGQTIGATSALLDLRDAAWHEFGVVHEVSEERSTIILLVGGTGLERSDGLHVDAVRVSSSR
jgi:hypothetical protein